MGTYLAISLITLLGIASMIFFTIGAILTTNTKNTRRIIPKGK